LAPLLVFSQQETIYYNANIFTANTEHPFADAIGIKGDKIIAVGNYSEVKKSMSSKATEVNLDGGCLIPGLVDSHRGKFLISVVLPWRDVPVVELLEKATRLPVVIDNSARCAALAEIWRDLFNVDPIGVNDDFFELGGHSLLATKFLIQIRETFDVDFPLAKFFEGPTVAQMASYLMDTTEEEPSAVSEPLAARTAG